MACELAKLYGKHLHPLVLVGRDVEKLRLFKEELERLGAKSVSIYLQDFRHLDSLAKLNHKISSDHQDVSLVVIAQGLLAPTMDDLISSDEVLEDNVRVNFTSYLSIINFWCQEFAKIKAGKIVVFSSVAGDRVRRSNYFYGSLKAGLSAYVEGISPGMAEKGVSLILLKPGLIDTKMTRHLTKNFLFISSQRAASIIFSGIQRNKRIVYVPGLWRWVMCVIKLIPDVIFRRLKF